MSLTSASSASAAPCSPSVHFEDVAASFAPPVPFAARRGEVTVDLVLRHAGAHRVTVRYELLGQLGAPVVCVAGGISAHRHAAASTAFSEPGWWDAQVGSGRALDPARVAVLAFDWVGADGALDVVIDPTDQADALAALLDALELDALDAFVGSSYGAMVGLQFAARHGDRLRRLVAISGTHRAHPYASAWRALQRQAVALGALQCDEAHGVALARQLAMLSYRTPEEFDTRFGAATVANGRVCVGAEAYLDHCGATYAARTPAAAFLRLSESIDLQAIEPESIAVPVDVVAIAQDRLVPLDDARELAGRLRDARLHVLHSPYGHDAFLKEPDAIARIIRDALAQEGVA
ncbi:homoserine O-succinyltransferase MetX [Cognatilysobacter bugurensis]|uniref:Homoserine O-acetyltransferase n=1 Tax=Cognatilysobacter bugurensis TaxID=543356 RepID=A0A918T003_9GAMM|nr:homoserine O-succinyltransferase [Lysobacter bugurensis]GHA77675.1 homoserine O-acetyltransferase [Lysobacter bugurensis]